MKRGSIIGIIGMAAMTSKSLANETLEGIYSYETGLKNFYYSAASYCNKDLL